MDDPILFAIFAFLTLMVVLSWAGYRVYYKPGRFLKQLGNPVITVAGQAIGTTNYVPRVEPNERRLQFVDNLTWTKGKHIVKLGADIASADDYSYFIQNFYGSYTYHLPDRD